MLHPLFNYLVYVPNTWRQLPFLLQQLQTVICNTDNDQFTFSNHQHENDTSSQQLCNQSCVCLQSVLSAHISIAPEQGRAGVSGAGWVTEGLMLALSEPSLPVKSSSDTTRTIEAQNCPLDFPLRQSWKKPVSHAGSGQENKTERETESVDGQRKNAKGRGAYSGEWLACINPDSDCVILGILYWLMSMSLSWRK